MDSAKPSQPPAGRPQRPWWRSSMWWWLAALIGFNLLLWSWAGGSQQSGVTISYTSFLAQVDAGNVVSISAEGDTITGKVNKAVTQTGGSATSTSFTTQHPAFASDTALMTLLQDKKVDVTATASGGGSAIWNLLLVFGPVVLLIAAFVWLMRRGSTGVGAGGGVFSMGRTRARRYGADTTPVTLADVAGIDEAKEELGEIIDFLREPEKYKRLGGSIPKGVLLVGPPGTGKTLLARAVAGEAHVAFFSVSGSEFVEMLVGVGAARVRDLFEKARAAAPAIIFIDELDAIGRSRGGMMRLSNEEQEQTLNQILTEMDGFDPREGVVVLAATNRPDVLDPALLRAGRFDRRVFVLPPDRAGRAAILAIHTRDVPLAKDVDLDHVAGMTPGLVGADLRNLVNEAALLAGRRGREAVEARDFSDALEKIMLGAARHIAVSPAERRRSAYHESGHALAGLLIPGADPVRKVSIVPRGRSLGVTVQAPVDDRQMFGEDGLRARIATALGGRAAEALVFGEVSTGAEADLLDATGIAREMVVRWGMSPAVGPLNFGRGDDGGPLTQQPYSPATAELIDTEMRRILEECLARAAGVLRDNRERLDRLAAALLDEESLEGDEVLRITGLSGAPAPQLATA